MKRRKGRRGYKIGTGAAPGEGREEKNQMPEDTKSILMEMSDPYWSFRFMRQNGVSRYGG